MPHLFIQMHVPSNTGDGIFVLATATFAYLGQPVTLSCPALNLSWARWYRGIGRNKILVACVLFRDNYISKHSTKGPLDGRISFHQSAKHLLYIHETVLSDEDIYTCETDVGDHNVTHLKVYGK